MDVLLLGLRASDEPVVLGVLRALGEGRVARASQWSNVPADADFGLIFVGADAVDPAWGAFEELLRREARGAVLIAMPHDDSATFTGAWDDTVWPHEASHDLLMRVVGWSKRLHAARAQVERWALRDPLTNLLNRRGLQQAVSRECSGRDRGQGPVSVVLVDVDDFKTVNDTLGMVGGDRVLRAVADRISISVRQQDSVARVGGDEFLVLLPGARTWEAVEVAERIRMAVEALPDEVTVSLGVKRLSEPVDSVDALLHAAQHGLKSSKAHGKNRVHLGNSHGDGSASLSGASLSDMHSLPPGTMLHRFRDVTLRHVATGNAWATMRMVDTDEEQGLQLAMQRAVQAAWDLHWFRQALQRGLTEGDSLHARLYPATLTEMAPGALLSKLPDGLSPSQVVVCLDEQFQSGDPRALLEPIGNLLERGVRFCLDVSDFGSSCLESLVILRPERVLLTAESIREAARSRSRRKAVHRFASVVRSLGLELLADGVDDGATTKVVTGLEIQIVGGMHAA